MKLRITLLAALAAVFAAALLTTTCESYDIPKEIELELLSVRIGDLEVSGIPQAISSEFWDDEEYEVGGAESGIVYVTMKGTENKRITATATPGATIQWGMAKGANRPYYFRDLRDIATFDIDDSFYFKVEDDTGAKYYRFYANYASAVKELVNVTIAGRDPDKIPQPAASLETLASSLNSATYRGQIGITLGDSKAKARVEAEPQDATATIRYARAESRNHAMTLTLDDFITAEKTIRIDAGDRETPVAVGSMQFTDEEFLLVEVTSQYGGQNYYGFRIDAGRMATIANLRFDSQMVAGKGVPHGVWGTVTPGSFASADQKDAGFRVSITLDDPRGSYEFVKVASITASQPAANQFDAAKGFDAPISFAHNEALAVRVHSASGYEQDNMYYIVRVELLAANFRKHPQSDYYYYYDAATTVGNGASANDGPINWYKYARLGDHVADGNIVDVENKIVIDKNDAKFKNVTVKPLKFTLDRNMPAGTRYQWYEANSWYGGYGFDKDGNILYYPEGADNPLKETGFTSDAYHQDHFDEKANVSLHNGGNQFYNMPNPGRMISGASGTFSGNGSDISYTPDIAKRPFIANYTNETHYYWVEITVGTGANAQRVVSKRAAIVSERDPTKKHHIVNLNAYMDGSVGLQGNPRNTNPFAYKREKRIVPITFPGGFNVKDYSVAIVQATFYLGDGKEWIQNWTQGDFGFEKDGEGLVLFYNLTNNNASYGLGSDSKEPLGASLDVTPSHIVVKPAGEKPPKQSPPFSGTETLPNGTTRPKPQNINDAQGWFTPFIEIVELRFEGPKR